MASMVPSNRPPAQSPRYRLPTSTLLRLLSATAFPRPHSVGDIAAGALRGTPRPPLILGAEHVPAQGPCLVTVNHYTRPGFGAWWTAIGVTAVVADRRAEGVPADIHWVMTAAWRYPKDDWRGTIVTPLTRWAFARAARAYGAIPMPPMPPRPDEVEERAAAVLRTVRLSRNLAVEGGLLGLAPEGRDTPGLVGDPPPRAGDFVALLIKEGFPILPVGVAEEDNRMRISFGPCFVPEIPRRRSERDRVVADQVMQAIAAQLP